MEVPQLLGLEMIDGALGRREVRKEGRRKGGKGKGSDVGNRVSECLKNDRHCMREVKLVPSRTYLPSHKSSLLVVGWAMSCCPTQLEHRLSDCQTVRLRPSSSAMQSTKAP